MRLLPGSTFSVCTAVYSAQRAALQRSATESSRAYDFQQMSAATAGI